MSDNGTGGKPTDPLAGVDLDLFASVFGDGT